jgi:hypothetical protein
MEKVDVIINVYGKPYQTFCTLKSLMEHCASHIDKIFFICELEEPFNNSALHIANDFDNTEVYMPPVNHYFEPRQNREVYNDETERFCLKYQYGIEKSNKKYVFITHNDILYTGDIIGEMLSQINDFVGIGLIGQCWNCPANKNLSCDGDKMEHYNPTYPEVLELLKSYLSPRTMSSNVDIEHPMPLPECRLNEFACIIDREITVKESWPNGDSPLFGSLNGIYGVDMGCEWFRSMVLKGYRFKNYDINKISQHGYFSPINSGLQAQNDINLYKQCEENAFFYYMKHYE